MWLYVLIVIALGGCDIVFRVDEFPTPAPGGPKWRTASYTQGLSTNTLTFSVEVPDVARRFVIVSTQACSSSSNMAPAPVVTNVQIGGHSATPLAAVLGLDRGRLEQWSLVAPQTGTVAVVVTWVSPADRVHASAMMFENVDQATPTREPVLLNGDTLGDVTLPVPSGENELVESTVGHGSAILGQGSEQTRTYLDNGTVDAALDNAAGSVQPGGAPSVDVRWVFESIDHTQVIAASLHP